MATPPPQIVQLSCPNCRTPVRAQIFTLVDVGQQPELKGRLLAGQLNLAVCQACGTPTMLSAPLIYHDSAKQLCLVFFPPQLNTRPEDQERFIGEATAAIMRNLPNGAPRGHLLAPRSFLTLNSLVDTVLEADGISREAIESQRKRVDLISRLAEAYDQGDEQLASIIEQHRAELDTDFFATLTAFIQASGQAGREDSAAMLMDLRRKLIELTNFQDEDEDDEESVDVDMELDAVIERLTSAPDNQVEEIIGEVRPVIDYSFFETWTNQIDEAEQAGDLVRASHLTSRRSLILSTVERLDQQAQALFEAGATVLNEVLAASDPAVALREHREQIDEAFLLVLETNINAAQRMGRGDIVQQLDEIKHLAAQVIQEALSPEDRFVNDLVLAETPQAATKLLRQHPAMITSAFVKHLNELADRSEQEGRKPISDRLRQLAREAGAMLF